MSSSEPNAPARPERQPPEIVDEESDEAGFLDADEGLDELDKTLADSFPASDPPQPP